MPTTPTRSRSRVVSISIGGTITSGTIVYLFNQNTGDRWQTTCNSSGEALADLANKTVEGNNSTLTAKGHIIEASVVGASYGYGSVTIGSQQDLEIAVGLTTDDGPAIVI